MCAALVLPLIITLASLELTSLRDLKMADVNIDKSALSISMGLSQPYWRLYERLIGQSPFCHVESKDETSRQYAEFIAETRRHQERRERNKESKTKKVEPEVYYRDIGQIEDDLVDTPDRNDIGKLTKIQKREADLIRTYGGLDNFENVRSMEMHIDNYFKEQRRRLAPKLWPVIPLCPKPYMSPFKQVEALYSKDTFLI